MINSVFGKDNKTVKFLKSLHDKKGRKQNGCFLLEGERAVCDSAKANGALIKLIMFSETFYNCHKELAEKLSGEFECYAASDKLFMQAADTENPQGIIAAVNIPNSGGFDFGCGEDVLILDSVSDPGNMGTIIRTAEAMGFNSIFLFGSCVDVYSPKVVRSTMGSVLREKVYRADEQDLEKLKNSGYKLYASALSENSLSLNSVKRSGKSAVIIGNEANGISKRVLDVADCYVKIPMKGKIESLNAAVAAAVFMYHFSEERTF